MFMTIILTMSTMVLGPCRSSEAIGFCFLANRSSRSCFVPNSLLKLFEYKNLRRKFYINVTLPNQM
jgi:hypothetical protein